MIRTALLLAAVLAGLASPASAEDDWFKAAEKARKTPKAQAENHGYATAAYEKVCGRDLVVTDAKLRAKKDRLYRKYSEYAFGYRWVVDKYGAVNSNFQQWEIYQTIYSICTGAESAGWAKVPEERKQTLENAIKGMRPER